MHPIGWIFAGLLVGFGTKMGNGCTSGHGVCGIARLNKRSIVAVLTFFITGVLSAIMVEKAGMIGTGYHLGKTYA